MDLNRDKKLDLVTSISPRGVLRCLGIAKGRFTRATPLLTAAGEPLRTIADPAGVHLCDWNGDGHLDMLVQLMARREASGVRTMLHMGSSLGLSPGSVQLFAADKVLSLPGLSAPWAVDWDGDKDLDLLACSYDGMVQLFRNGGSRQVPELQEAEVLQAALPGVGRARFCLTDWNQDGLQDLLLNCSQGLSKPGEELSKTELAHLADAEKKIDALLVELKQLNNSRPSGAEDDFRARAEKRKEWEKAMAGPRDVRKELKGKRDGKEWSEIRIYLLRRLR